MAFGLFDVIIETVGVLSHTEFGVAEGIALVASDAKAVRVSVAMWYFADGLVGKLERIRASIASIISIGLTSDDGAPAISESEGSIA